MNAPVNYKSSGIALLLNFLLPGAGHLYASGGSKGVALLIVNIVVALLFPVVYFTILINIGIWIYAMATSSSVTAEYNALLDGQIAQSKRESEVRAEQAETSKRLAQEQAARRITGYALAEEFSKLAKLRDMKVITDNELALKKEGIFSGLREKYTNENIGDFFIPFGILIEGGVVDQSDVDRLKEIYEKIYRPE